MEKLYYSTEHIHDFLRVYYIYYYSRFTEQCCMYGNEVIKKLVSYSQYRGVSCSENMFMHRNVIHRGIYKSSLFPPRERGGKPPRWAGIWPPRPPQPASTRFSLPRYHVACSLKRFDSMEEREFVFHALQRRSQ